MTEIEDQARSIFLAALERVPDQWPAFVDEACGGNVGLRARVEQLLHAHQAMGSIHGGGGAAPAATIDEPLREGPGTVIGPYKLLQQIGEGGMGTVFMAEQLQPLRRKVALKVVKPGMDTRQVVARFEAERQALALMDHPYIAHVLDAGETASGRPYFVMELVRGIPITDYCDQNTRTAQERLELFVAVCQAVQHAHLKGIIHRDVKPSNVLVTLHDGTPVVKVIDFGIAKAIGQQLTDKTLFTNFTQMMGTPLYMSPEQVELSGLDIDTRTDIYSLGVLLYELLTGTTPFDKARLREASYDEIRRIIREEEPPKPSTRISTMGLAATTVFAQRKSDPRRLGQLFRGELDWIVMKCLEKDRNRRYETASALAADLHHYLDDEPVLACPPSAWYRFRKFTRRNKAALLIAASAFVLLVAAVAALSVTNWLVSREEQRKNDALADAKAQQARAEANLAKADANFQRAMDAVDRMLTRAAVDRLGGQPGLHPVRRQLLEDALTFYQEFLKERGSEPQVRFEASRAYGRMAGIYKALGETGRAEEAAGQALEMIEQLCKDQPKQPRYESELAECHFYMAALFRSIGGRVGEAEQHIRRTISTYQGLVARLPHAESQRYRSRLAGSHAELGYALMHQSERFTEGERAYKTALALSGELTEESPQVWEFRRDQPGFCNSLGLFYRLNNRPQEAEQAHRQALAILKQLSADFPGTDIRGDECRAYFHLGLALWQLNRRDEAIGAALRVLEIDRVLPSIGEDPGTRGGRAINYHSLGQMLELTGRQTEAEQAYRKALALAEQERAEYADVPIGHEAWINVHFSLCRLLAASNRLDEANDLFHRVVAWTPPSDKGLNLLAWRLATGPDSRFRDSARALELARKLVERVPGDGLFRNTLGVAEYRAGDWKAAIGTLEKSQQLLAGSHASYNLFFLAMAHWQLGDKEQARKLYDQAIEWMQKHGPKNEELIRFRTETEALINTAELPNKKS